MAGLLKIGASGCPVHCGKTAYWIRMPFDIIGRTDPGIRQVVGFGHRSTGRGAFGAKFGCAIVPNGYFTAYVYDSAAKRPSSQNTLANLFTEPSACVMLSCQENVGNSHANYKSPSKRNLCE